MRRLRSSVVVTVALGTVLAAAPPASAAQLGFTNTEDGFSAFAAEADVVFEPGGDQVVDAANVAQARNEGCTGCRTAIVAFQLVVVQSDAATVSPTNIAVAENIEADDAFAFADARQVVVTVPGATRLTPRGDAMLRKLNRDLLRLDKPFSRGATDAELDARLDVLEEDLRDLVDDLAGAREDTRDRRSAHRHD